MDGYKKVLKSRRIRETILALLSFLPDEVMLKFQYKIKTGRRLNLKNPERFTEKLQFYKLHYRNPILHTCVDKLLVREYVKSKGLEDILVKLYSTYKNANEVDLTTLPNSFVLKTTNGGGGNNVVICKNKDDFELKSLSKSIKTKKYRPRTAGREWAYYNNRPMIIAEEFLRDNLNSESGINDYKFFCYDGKPEYVVVDADRYTLHKRNFYDIKWNNLNIISDCPPIDREMPKPKNFDRMIEIASILSEGFPFVRVDLYNINGEVKFGELTFYPWSGYVIFQPDSADAFLGEKMDLSKMRSENKRK